MTAPIPRITRLLPIVALVLGGCTQFAGIEGPTETYASGSATRMFATTYRFIDSQYIRAVPIGDVAADGLRALEEIDPLLALNVSGQRIQLASADTVVADLQAPSADDVGGWVNVTVDLIEASRVASPAIRDVPPEVLYESIVDDAISSLDRYTRYASASDAADDRADREGFGGVGITISVTESEGVDVLAVLPDTPAVLAGLEVGDRIIAVDGESVLGLTVRQVVARLRGPIGSQVALTVLRGTNAQRELTLSVNRAYVIAPTVLSEVEGDIAVVHITSFNVQTAQDVEQQLVEAYGRSGGNIGAVIIDLRNNPGGLLDQATDVADLFVNGGLIGTAEGRHPNSHQRFLASAGDMVTGRPIAVLTNGDTASAAEVLAAGLQDLGRAVIIGSTSYGKGTVQTVNRLPNDGELTLTWSALHAPSGYTIHTLGVRPNVCTSGHQSAASAIRDATDNTLSTAEALRQWRTHRALELDAHTTLLRAECEPAQGINDIDMEVARAVLADPAFYQSLIDQAPRVFASAPRS